MRLNERLKLIADSIPRCKILTDIGTDHAYIPINAVQKGTCERALAADLREGPLGIARNNISRHGLEHKIETRLGDGLSPIMTSECDVIVIAGMGGPLIRRILSDSFEKSKKARTLLLQPNNAVDALRRWLYENGFAIHTERLVEDSHKLYCLIEAGWTGVSQIKDDFEYYIGEKIFIRNEALLKKYLKKKLGEIDKIISGRARSDPDKVHRIEDETTMSTAACINIRNRLVEYLEDFKTSPEGE